MGFLIVVTEPSVNTAGQFIDSCFCCAQGRSTGSTKNKGAASNSPVAQYVTEYAVDMPLWDELTFAAWLDPSIITERHTYFLDVDINHGSSYGSTLVCFPGTNPDLGE